ncbi:hemin ABC transporter substrate-binding protein [Lutimaribacter marinistellae]|uniref:Hemin ABC transporter substrate-binding protein n=1 Tax=Lutimaribacter marinistellae TaxID=1820329 RepID=A0ABV7TA91_9RHOB
MKRVSLLGGLQIALTSLLAIVALTATLRAEPAQRIVSVGGSVTEIVYALGQEHRLVARDTTSNHPEAVTALPDVGYIRRLSPEGLLSVDPDMILAEEGAGPPEALELLSESQIPVVTIPTGFDRAAVLAKIEAVASVLDVPEEGAALAARVGAEIDRAAARELSRKKVLFVLSMQGGRIMAGGQNTAAEGIISLSGAENAAQGFEGYKLLTDEAVLTAAPDVILVMNSRGDRHLSDEALLSHPGLAATPAGQTGAILRMDGMLLLGFSVRTGQAVTELANGLERVGS